MLKIIAQKDYILIKTRINALLAKMVAKIVKDQMFVTNVYLEIKFKNVNGDNTMTISHNNVLTVE